MKKKWFYILTGFVVIGCATLFGYLYLKGYEGDPRVVTVKDMSIVEPGLGLRILHERGYTGKGLNVAIIDGNLLQEHDEYNDRLVHFEKVGDLDDKSLYHGTTVASVLVGKKCGVLPEASLHYFATDAMDEKNVLEALKRVLSYNDSLPEQGKIRFVSISTGLREEEVAFHELIHQAKNKGIIVFTSTMPTVTQPSFALREGAYEDRGDMNDLNNVGIGDWMNEFLAYNNLTHQDLIKIRKDGDELEGFVNVYLPCARRYVASFKSSSEYVYDLDGGLSWATPMLAGLAAMVTQVNPTLSNDDILLLLADSIVENDKGLNVINPALLITLAEETTK